MGIAPTPARAPRSRLWRWLKWGTLGVVALLALVVVLALDPARQKDFLLPKITPLVDRLAVDYLHVTPWSVEIRGLTLSAHGAEVAVGKLALGVNPLSLLMDTVSVRYLTLEAATIDLQKFQTPPGPPPSKEPFPGVLNAFDQGYSIALREVDAKAAVTLPGKQYVTLALTGGGLRPHFPGSIAYKAAMTVGAGQAVKLEGELMLDQLMGGALRKLGAKGQLELQWTGLPATEYLSFDLTISPQPGAGGERYRARRARLSHDTLPPPAPEALAVALRVLAPDGRERARFNVDAEYAGADGRVAGSFKLGANTGLITPYTGTAALPSIEQAASGRFSFGALDGSFDLDLDNDVALGELNKVLGENPLLPKVLHARSRVTLAGQPARIVVTRFEHSLAPDSALPVVQAHLTTPLSFDPKTPEALLASPQAFGVLEITDLPLPWLNGLLGDVVLTGGMLRGGLEVAADDEQRLVATSITPLSTGPVAARQGDAPLFDDLSLTVMPRFRRSPQSIRVWFESLALTHAGQQLLAGELRARHPVDPAEGDGLGFDLSANVDALRAMPALAQRLTDYPLPAGLTAKVAASLRKKPATVEVNELDLSVAQTSAPGLFRLKAEQAFSVGLGSNGPSLHNPQGTLARLSVRQLDLAWASPFIPDTHLAGRIEQAEFQLRGERDNALTLRAASPLRLRGLSVEQGGHDLLAGIDLGVNANLEYRPDRLRATLEGLSVRSRGQSLISGRLGLGRSLKGAALSAEGKLALDANQLLRQPALAGLMGGRPLGLKVDADLDFGLDYAAPKLTVQRLDLGLRTDRKANLRLRAEPGLEVLTTLVPAEQYARAVVGTANLEIRDFSSEVLNLLAPVAGVGFSNFSAAFKLKSDGTTLHADSSAPLRLESVRLATNGKPLLDPFNVEIAAQVDATGRVLALDITRLQLAFARAAAPALEASFRAEVQPDEAVPLKSLKLALSAALPQWLSQPAVMPGHQLTAGTLAAKIDVTVNRELTARLAFDGLAGRKPLGINTLELPVTGEVTADGRGFKFTAPVIARGKSGASNATLDARFAPDETETPLLDLRLNSTVFYLNDLLSALANIAPPAPAAVPVEDPEGKAPAAVAATPLNEARDAHAGWDVLPYGTRLRFDIDKLYYTDYLAFDAVGGELNVRRRRLELSDFTARFHASPITLDGGLRFKAEAPQPYTLALTGKVKDFDLQTFSSELVPGEKPQVEGLFSVDMDASGEMPNLGQLRNRAYFDIHMTSRDGVFRPLPPSSPLLIGASEVLGIVGEGLSYAPTGGFGAGAVARLVNYISRIDYDLIEIRVRRGKSKRVRLSRFLMQSPTVLMSARGGVDYVPGKDLLDSPLDLKGSLNMLGRGAAILYSMDLMREGRDDYGYFQGPEFLVSGTPAAPESNFSAIIEQAGEGTLKGGITRPLSGLIGNLKYRWFGPNEKPQVALPPEGADAKE